MISTQVVELQEVFPEARGMITLRFRLDEVARPGQFVMVWIPGVDEIPMSLSYLGARKGITVKSIGEASGALSSLREGDRMGIRGPYGNGFRMGQESTLCVAGGTGAATILPAVEALNHVDAALGALTSSELLFEERARASARKVMMSTDDGSRGYHGTVVDMVSDEVGEYDMVLGCGPEPMLSALLDLCNGAGVDCQLSLERYMKCGIGLCGSCALDGQRVCADGPVFTGGELSHMEEFGRSRRDTAGRRRPL
ncbi:MAG: dihydroorotate dehydrogenase electron transfer subunit [Methanomassiliicoccales archaeon]